MKVLQLNKINKGFYSDGEDGGVDEQGGKAMGFQGHDALWWPCSEEYLDPAIYYSSITKDPQGMLDQFDRCFSDLSKNILSTYNPKSLLELGCGSGHLYSKFKDKVETIVTVDANEVASKNSPYLKEADNHFWARTDHTLDFIYEDGETVFFDVVVSLEHFEHVEHVNTFLENISKHTKEGSIIIFTTSQWKYTGAKDHIHCCILSEKEWDEKLKEIGFEEINCPFSINRVVNTAQHPSFEKVAIKK